MRVNRIPVTARAQSRMLSVTLRVVSKRLAFHHG